MASQPIRSELHLSWCLTLSAAGMQLFRVLREEEGQQTQSFRKEKKEKVEGKEGSPFVL